MKPLTSEERDTAGSLLHAVAHENAVESLIEKYGRDVLQQYEHLDLHPEYMYLLLASGESALEDMRNDREYTGFGLPRVATYEESQAIYDECSRGGCSRVKSRTLCLLRRNYVGRNRPALSRKSGRELR